MRRGSFIEGVLAGIKSYMAGKQWYEQMKQNRIKLESMKLANRLAQLQLTGQQFKNELEMNPEAYGRYMRERYEATKGILTEQERAKLENEIKKLEKTYELAKKFHEKTGVWPQGFRPPTISGGSTNRPYTSEQARSFVDGLINRLSIENIPSSWYDKAIDAAASGNEGIASAIITTFADLNEPKYNWIREKVDPETRDKIIEYVVALEYNGATRQEIDNTLNKFKEKLGIPPSGSWIKDLWKIINAIGAHAEPYLGENYENVIIGRQGFRR